jgi:hypothetical protein
VRITWPSFADVCAQSRLRGEAAISAAPLENYIFIARWAEGSGGGERVGDKKSMPRSWLRRAAGGARGWVAMGGHGWPRAATGGQISRNCFRFNCAALPPLPTSPRGPAANRRRVFRGHGTFPPCRDEVQASGTCNPITGVELLERTASFLLFFASPNSESKVRKLWPIAHNGTP